MSFTGRAVVLYKPWKLSIEEREVPVLKPDEVLIKVKIAAVCLSTDVALYEGRRPFSEPLVPGQESSGVIEDIGDEVTRFKKGDRVVFPAQVPCRVCEQCISGRPDLCRYEKVIGRTLGDKLPAYSGSFADYVVIPEFIVLKIGDNTDFEEASMVQPVGTGVLATRRGNMKLGDTVAVFGAGHMGLLAFQAAFCAGATEVYIVDLDEQRLDVARRLGVTAAINAKQVNPVEQIKKLTGDRGVDFAIEAVGCSTTYNQSIEVLRRGGRAVFIGAIQGSKDMNIDVSKIAGTEVEVTSAFRGTQCFPIALKLIDSKRVRVKEVITHRFPFTKEGVEEAFLTTLEKRDNAIKVIVVID